MSLHLEGLNNLSVPRLGFRKRGIGAMRSWPKKLPSLLGPVGGARFMREASPSYERDSCNIEFHKGCGKKPVDFQQRLLSSKILRCMMWAVSFQLEKSMVVLVNAEVYWNHQDLQLLAILEMNPKSRRLFRVMFHFMVQNMANCH